MFEYKILKRNGEAINEGTLNKLGAERWDLVCISLVEGRTAYIFKRKVKGDKK